MATRSAAFQEWASGFGIPAYAASSVPDDAEMPYITYTVGFNGFEEGDFAAQLDIWYRGGDQAAPNAKAEELSKALGRGGKVIACDGGAIWLKRGTPFWQAVADAEDVQRRYVNIDIESLGDF